MRPSPVAMLKSVRIMLALAAFFNYEIWQMDVKTMFLNGFLKEELYMMQPGTWGLHYSSPVYIKYASPMSLQACITALGG